MTAASGFWSQRRARVRAEEEAEARRAAEEKQAAETQALEAKSDADVLAELGLPDPDTMTSGDDFAAFMSRAIPERLRRRALRRLWTSNPTLACVDGLNDYDGDFTGTGVEGGVLKTAYKVGRGYLKEIVTEPQTAAAAPEGEAETVAAAVEPELAETPPPSAENQPAQNAANTPDVSPAPRRMTFSFADSDGATAGDAPKGHA